jgi:starch synthase
VEVVDGVGELFRAGDAADLGRQLRELLADPARLATLGARARERIGREYGWEAVAGRTADLYRSLLSGGRNG